MDARTVPDHARGSGPALPGPALGNTTETDERADRRPAPVCTAVCTANTKHAVVTRAAAQDSATKDTASYTAAIRSAKDFEDQSGGDNDVDPNGTGHPSSRPAATDRGSAPTVRVDVWLVAVRLAKTRAIAAKACKGGQVAVNGDDVKPASPVAVGDHLVARLGGRDRIVEVTRLIDKRVGAAIAQTCYIDHSPPMPPSTRTAAFAVRDPGSGRPTKKDRRQIDRLRGR